MAAVKKPISPLPSHTNLFTSPFVCKDMVHDNLLNQIDEMSSY